MHVCMYICVLFNSLTCAILTHIYPAQLDNHDSTTGRPASYFDQRLLFRPAESGYGPAEQCGGPATVHDARSILSRSSMPKEVMEGFCVVIPDMNGVLRDVVRFDLIYTGIFC